jgi:cyclopropane fatty-acyl-phospholipid synthase-like methyltransferase
LYSLTLARQHEHARLTLLDWPNVLAITRGTVDEMGLLERTSFIEGDVFDMPLGGPYDLIVASHIFHHFSEERCVALMRRLAGALKPDGRLAINDFMAAETKPQEEPFPRLFSVIMLVFTQEGEAYSIEAYEQMLREAGFDAPDVHEGHGMPSRFLIASPLSA